MMVLLLIGCLLISSNIFGQSSLKAKVLSLENDVRLKKSKNSKWVKVEINQSLQEGDSLKTGNNSSAEIAFDKENKDVVRLKSNTTVLLKKLGDNLKVVELSSGEIFSLVSSLNSGRKFEIKTPTAAAGARGTGWGAKILSNGASFSAYLNEIYVQAFDSNGNLIDEEVLKEGMKVLVEAFKEVGDIIEMTQQEKNAWNEWLDNLESRLSDALGSNNPAQEILNVQQEMEEVREEFWEERIQDNEDFEDRSSGSSGSEGQGEIVYP